MRSGSYRVGLALALAAAVLAPSARAVPIVDQSNHATNILGDALVFETSISFQQLAQTFTVGVAGTLTRIDVDVLTNASSVGTLILEVQGVAGGIPDGTVLASNTLTSADVVDGFNVFDVSGAGLGVSVGDVLSFVMRGTGDYNLSFTGFGADSYLGGAGLIQSHNEPGFSPFGGVASADLRFDTFVDAAAAPEPATSAVLWAGLALGFARRRSSAGWTGSIRGSGLE